MPSCSAFGCSNNTSTPGIRSYHRFPNATKNLALLAAWIHNIGTGFTVHTFRDNKYVRVCSEHFHPECFVEDKIQLLLGYKPKAKLKDGAIPTLFKHKIYQRINIDGTVIGERVLSGKITQLQEHNMVCHE